MKKILIAEDNATVRKLLKSDLQKHEKRFTSIFVWNGEEAIAVLKSEKIDLLVTDLRMPKVNGFELLAYMNEKFPLTPCIVMTARGSEKTKRLVEDDILAYLEKPFETEKLIELIDAGLESQDAHALEQTQNDCIFGISLANFLQLLQLEEKTHLMEIFVPGTGTGYIYIKKGELYDAVYKQYNGTEAALRLIELDRAQVCFKPLPKKKIKQRIHENLTSLLLRGRRISPDPNDAE